MSALIHSSARRSAAFVAYIGFHRVCAKRIGNGLRGRHVAVGDDHLVVTAGAKPRTRRADFRWPCS